MFREKDILHSFKQYSNGKPQSLLRSYKFESGNKLSGNNLIHDAVKNIAKGAIDNIKIDQERNDKVGKQEHETQLLIDYYNNKHVIDEMPEDDGKSYYGKGRKLNDIDQPFLKANTKTFKAGDNPKIAKDMINIDTLNMSMDSD